MAGAREIARAQVMADIARVGREHLRTGGAAALSLRAVARDLGMVSSAIYRYVESRDALLTLLVVDAYDALGEAAERAEAATRRRSVRHRWQAVTRAIRTWAVAHPGEYALVFGTPVPGYSAPEMTVGHATRVPAVLLRLLEEARAEGMVAPPVGSAPVRRDLRAVAEMFGSDVDEGLMAQGVLAWTGLFGVLSFEVFGQYANTVDAHPEAWFDEAMARLLA